MSYLYSPLYPVARRSRLPWSHRGGWALYWAQALDAALLTSEDDREVEARLRKGDRVFLYHGMEFPAFLAGRPLNVPPGTEAAFAARAARFARLARRFGPRLVSLDLPMPAYGALLAKRAAYPSAGPLRAAFAAQGLDPAQLDRDLRRGRALLWPDADELIFGDSHALNQVDGGERVYRVDGITLHGALARGLDQFIDWHEHDVGATVPLTLSVGNVDLRHHLARPGATPIADLVAELERQLRPYARSRSITLVAPLPLPSDERHVPKTGWYQGAPCYGTWVERERLRVELDERLHGLALRSRCVYRDHPTMFTEPSDVDYGRYFQLTDAVMERPGSVHVAPAHYRRILNGRTWSCL